MPDFTSIQQSRLMPLSPSGNPFSGNPFLKLIQAIFGMGIPRTMSTRETRGVEEQPRERAPIYSPVMEEFMESPFGRLFRSAFPSNLPYVEKMRAERKAAEGLDYLPPSVEPRAGPMGSTAGYAPPAGSQITPQVVTSPPVIPTQNVTQMPQAVVPQSGGGRSITDIIGAVLLAGATGNPFAWQQMKQAQIEQAERQKDRDLQRESVRLQQAYNKMKMESEKRQQERMTKPIGQITSLAPLGEPVEPSGYMDLPPTGGEVWQRPVTAPGPTLEDIATLKQVGIPFELPEELYKELGVTKPAEVSKPVKAGEGLLYDPKTKAWITAPTDLVKGKKVQKVDLFESDGEWFRFTAFTDGTGFIEAAKPGAFTSTPGAIQEKDLPLTQIAPWTPQDVWDVPREGEQWARKPWPTTVSPVPMGKPVEVEPKREGLPAPRKKPSLTTIKSFDKKTGEKYEQKAEWDGKQLKPFGPKQLVGVTEAMTEDKARKRLAEIAGQKNDIATTKANLKIRGVTTEDLEKIADTTTRAMMQSLLGMKLRKEDYDAVVTVLDQSLKVLDEEEEYLRNKYLPKKTEPEKSLGDVFKGQRSLDEIFKGRK